MLLFNCEIKLTDNKQLYGRHVCLAASRCSCCCSCCCCFCSCFCCCHCCWYAVSLVVVVVFFYFIAINYAAGCCCGCCLFAARFWLVVVYNGSQFAAAGTFSIDVYAINTHTYTCTMHAHACRLIRQFGKHCQMAF